jgi:hypothetical protein
VIQLVSMGWAVLRQNPKSGEWEAASSHASEVEAMAAADDSSRVQELFSWPRSDVPSRLVSASALTRAKRCPSSYALPQISETSDAAEQGNENHARVEAELAAYRRTMDPSSLSPELHAVLDGAQVQSIELAVVLDVFTGTVREVGESVGRAYGKVDPAREVPMTLDVVTRKGGLVVIRDWKSRKRVTPAVRNDQIRAQATAMIKLLGVDAVEAGLTYLDNWESDLAPFDAFDAEEVLGELRQTLERVQAAKADDPVALGPWCEYCPAMASCPARQKLLRASAAMVRESTIEQTLADVTDETAGSLYERFQSLADAVERAIKLLRDRAKHSPLPLPNGKVLAAIEGERKSLDAKKAEALLTAANIPIPIKTTTYVQVREMNPKKDSQ